MSSKATSRSIQGLRPVLTTEPVGRAGASALTRRQRQVAARAQPSGDEPLRQIGFGISGRPGRRSGLRLECRHDVGGWCCRYRAVGCERRTAVPALAKNKRPGWRSRAELRKEPGHHGPCCSVLETVRRGRWKRGRGFAARGSRCAWKWKGEAGVGGRLSGWWTDRDCGSGLGTGPAGDGCAARGDAGAGPGGALDEVPQWLGEGQRSRLGRHRFALRRLASARKREVAQLLGSNRAFARGRAGVTTLAAGS
jgi:hypothetical protein